MTSISLRPALLAVSFMGLVACSSSSLPNSDGSAGTGGGAQAGTGGGTGGGGTGGGGTGGSALPDAGDARGPEAGGQGGSAGAPPDAGSCNIDVVPSDGFVTGRCAVFPSTTGGGPIPDGSYDLVDYTLSGVSCPNPPPPPVSRAFRVSGTTIEGVDLFGSFGGGQPMVSAWRAEMKYFGSSATINFQFSCGKSSFGTIYSVKGNEVWFTVKDSTENLTHGWYFRKR